MKCYPLGIAGILAVTCDCIRRGDLEAAQAALARAAQLSSDVEGTFPAEASPSRAWRRARRADDEARPGISPSRNTHRR